MTDRTRKANPTVEELERELAAERAARKEVEAEANRYHKALDAALRAGDKEKARAEKAEAALENAQAMAAKWPGEVARAARLEAILSEALEFNAAGSREADAHRKDAAGLAVLLRDADAMRLALRARAERAEEERDRAENELAVERSCKYDAELARDRAENELSEWKRISGADSAEQLGANILALRRECSSSEAEVEQAEKERDEAQEAIQAWKDASGLTCGGDPDGVTPAMLARDLRQREAELTAALAERDEAVRLGAVGTHERDELAREVQRLTEREQFAIGRIASTGVAAEHGLQHAVDGLLAALQRTEKERDEARESEEQGRSMAIQEIAEEKAARERAEAMVAEALRHRQDLGAIISETMTALRCEPDDNVVGVARALVKDKDRAEADNAALVLRIVLADANFAACKTDKDRAEVQELLTRMVDFAKTDHPGAALLEELQTRDRRETSAIASIAAAGISTEHGLNHSVDGALEELRALRKVVEAFREVEYVAGGDWRGDCPFRRVPGLVCLGSNGAPSGFGTPKPVPHSEHCPYHVLHAARLPTVVPSDAEAQRLDEVLTTPKPPTPDLQAALDRLPRIPLAVELAQLRHAYDPAVRDWEIVAGVIRRLERATTPGAPRLDWEKK